ARAVDVRGFMERHTGAEARFLVLGHMQRGGSPTALDRVLALRLGSFAAHRLIGGFSGEMAGVDGGRLVSHPLSYVFSSSRTIDPERLLLASTMAQ
ncbi:MAG TPA: 6-phosphofructokinase, partial [Fimbriimonadaceae bacterium]|nr:6-phosphofructokinase [Fimbriimonadaceae bacterium]